MRRGMIVAIVLVVVVGIAHAAQIVPVFIDSSFGPQRPTLSPGCVVQQDAPTVKAVRCDIVVPAGAVEIAGWSGTENDISNEDPLAGPLAYMTMEVWHDGGVAHRLAKYPAWTPGGNLDTVFLPAGDGHKCVPGDQVFAIFWCVGFVGARQPWCVTSLTVHFRLGP